MMTETEVKENKDILRQFLNGYGVEVQNAIAIALTLLDKQTPKKTVAIKGVSSQACPICHSNVCWNYCPTCGQRISYTSR